MIWLRLLFIYPKPLYDTPIVKESECNNRNDKRQYQKENQHNQRRQQGYLNVIIILVGPFSTNALSNVMPSVAATNVPTIPARST